MDVLFMGNLTLISKRLLSKMEKKCRCVLYSEKNDKSLRGKGIINYVQESLDEENIRKIFSTFDFDTVIFFSSALDGAQKIYDEFEKMENAVLASCKHKVKQFIYVTTNELYMHEDKRMEGQSRKMVMDACEKLCRICAAQHSIKFLILRVPYLYNLDCGNSQIMKWILQADKGEKVVIQGSSYQETDFLCDEDLGELLSQILDEPLKNDYEEMFLSGGNTITLGDLAGIMERQIQGVKIVYGNHTDCIPVSRKDTKARKEYGWYPRHILENDMEQMILTNRKSNKTKGRKWEDFR